MWWAAVGCGEACLASSPVEALEAPCFLVLTVASLHLPLVFQRPEAEQLVWLRSPQSPLSTRFLQNRIWASRRKLQVSRQRLPRPCLSSPHMGKASVGEQGRSL